MATELHDKLTFIYEEKNKKILPENIKKGIKVFDVEGVADVLDTSDANATASDLLAGKSAYVQGKRVEGTIPSIETLTIKPELETEQITEYNAKVGSIQIPSLIDSAEEYSKIIRYAGSMVGGVASASQTITVNTVPGGTVLVAIMHRNAITLSTTGWTQIYHDYTVTPEGWYQFLTVYYKYANGSSETLKVSDPGSGRLAVGMWTYDQGAEPEVIWTGGNNTERISSYPVSVMTQYNDILIAHQYWSSGSGLWFSGFGNGIGTNRCTDGRLIMVGITNSTDQGRITHDTSSQGTGCLVRFKSVFTSDSIRKGRVILGITGTYTEDADATAADIMTGKTAYVNGVKVTGNIATLGEEVQVSATDASINEDNTKFIISSETPSSGILSQGATYQITADGQQVMDALSLAPDMLRAGVNILGVEGTYGADASEFTAKYEPAGRTSNLSPQSMLTTIQSVNMEGVVDGTNAFYNLWNLKSLPEMNLNSVTNMSNMFYNCCNVIYAPNYDIPKVTTMINAFYNCSQLKTINFSNSNNLSSIQYAFKFMNNLTAMPNMNYGYISSAYEAFMNDVNLNGKVDLSGFIRSGAVSDFQRMFLNCSNITGVEGYNKQGTAYLYTNYMFANCYNLQTVNNCNFFNINGSSWLFDNCYNLHSVTNSGFSWAAQNVYTPQHSVTNMFANCVNLVTLDNNFWTNAYWFGMSNTFYNCSNLIFPEHVEIKNYGYNYGGALIDNTFTNCHLLKSVSINFLSGHNTNGYRNVSGYLTNTFRNCSNLHTVVINNGTTSNRYSLINGEIFTGCNNLTNIYININRYNSNTGYSVQFFAAGSGITSINNLTGTDIFGANSVYGLFQNCTKLYDLGTEYLNFWKAKSGMALFRNCHNLKNIEYTQINVNNMTSIQYMFEGIGQTSDFKDWTFPNVTAANYCFGNLHVNSLFNINMPKLIYGDGMFANSNISEIKNLNFPVMVNANNLFRGAKVGNVTNISTGLINNAINMYADADIGHMQMPNFTANIWQASFMFANSNIEDVTFVQNFNIINGGVKMFDHVRNANWIKRVEWFNVPYANYMFTNVQAEKISNLNLNCQQFAPSLFSGSDSKVKVIENIRLKFGRSDWATAYTFANVPSLEEVHNVEYLSTGNGQYLFQNDYNLLSVSNINMGTTMYGQYMFSNCYNLRSVENMTMPMLNYASYMFMNCRNLYTYPNINYNQFAQIDYMFQGCVNLTSLPAIECNRYSISAVRYSLPNLTDCGGFINLGNTTWNYRYNNNACNFYLNYYPNLTQRSIFNIVNGMYQMSNSQRFYITMTQNNLLDDEHRKILSNKRWSVYTVNDPA